MGNRIVLRSMRALAFVTVCIASVGIVSLAHGQTAQSPTSSGTNLASVQTSAAQQPGQVDQSQSVVRSSPSVEAALHHDVSPPLFLIPPAPRQAGQRVHPVRPIPRRINGGAVDPVVQQSVPTILAPAPILNFDGVGNGFSGPSGTFTVQSAPPDTEGDVGLNHYVQIVNTDFAVFNKSGTAIYGPVPINTLWTGFGGLCQTDNDGDPIAIYDPIADRWVISQLAITGANGITVPFLQCVAVSQTADPTGAYNRYSFAYNSFNDYPKMGVWPDAYYTTFNFFNAAGTSFLGGEVCAYDRTKMLAGQPATQQCFNVGVNYGGLLPADLDGKQLPPVGSPDYVLALGVSNNDLALWKFHVDWTTPANTTLTGPITLTVATYTAACNGGTCIPQAGTTQQLDSLADRLMFRLAYRNFGDHEALVANHSVTAGSSVGARWYEIRSPGTTPTIFQQGTYAPDSNFRWMGSIAMDQSGNMALGFSVSGSSIHPEIHYTGRLAGDPAGQMTQGEGTFIDGAGSQSGSRGLTRWGDYSMMAVDPSDDCTFWYTNEYIPSTGEFNWSTRIGSFKFPGCPPSANDFSISANPTSLSLLQGASGTSTISTAVTSGSAETVNLSVSGAPSGATASLSPTSVTAGGSSTLTVNTGTAAAGTYTLTVTGTAASATHMTTVTLTVSAATATHFGVSAPVASTAGTAFNFTVSARDALNNITTGYRGTVHFTSSDVQAVLPADYTFAAADSGVHTFSATLKTAGSQTITATDTGNATITGTSNAITVTAAAATHFAVSAPATATAGTAFNFTVTAKDAFNNTVTGYAGTVHFTSTDSQAVLPANTTLTSGTGTFPATLKTLGSQTITATDTGNATITGTSNAITVNAAAASSLTVAGFPSPNTAGVAGNFTVTARDALNNIAAGYRGTVHFTSSDAQAALPADYTFTAADSGVHTFSATLKTAGTQSLTATDTAIATITGSQTGIVVSPASASSFAVAAPGTARVGTAFNFTVTAKDAFNNTVTGYAGTVHFTSTDSQAVLPANTTLTSGTSTLLATLKTAGNQRIVATDTTNATITGTSANILVSAGSPASIAPTSGTPQSATVNTPFATPFQATVKDGGGNGVPGVTVTFTAPSTGASGTFANGTATTTATTNASGVATASTFTANGTAGGPYTIAATVTGVATAANFSLTNTASTPARIALVQHTSIDAGTTTSSTLAFNANNTTGNWIGVCIRAGQPGEVFTVADSRGNAYRKAIQFNETVDGTTLGVFYAENIFGGPNTITVSDTISGTLRFAILEYSGVAIANSLDGAAIAAQGTSASPNSGNLTTTANGDLLLGEIWTANPANFTAGSGYLIEERVPTEPNTKLIAEDQVQAVAGSISATASLAASDNWGAGLAAFKAAGSGPPTVATPTFNPGAGTYGSAQSVSITSTTSGATICYTIDGSTPVASTPGTCSTGTALANGGSVVVSTSETLKAIGTESTFVNSAVGSATYTINSCAQNLAIGAYTLCGEAVNDTTGASVSVNYSPYPSNGIIAWASWCFTSSCTTSIAGVTATIGDNINATESCFTASPHSPFITNANGGAQGSGDFEEHYIWYCPSIPSGVTSFTMTPSNSSLFYLTLNISEWKAGSLAASCVPISACFEDVDNLSQAGNTTGGTTATITTSGPTVNANDLIFVGIEVPCCSFTPSAGAGYTGITVAPPVSIGMVSEAKAVTTTGSQTATATWTGGNAPWFGEIVPLKGAGTAPVVATPTFNPGAGTYGSAQSVSITSTTSGATICYTIDGSTPVASTPGTCSTGTTLANGGTVTVGVSETLQAIGTKSGLTNSAVGSAAYVITVATPSITNLSPTSGLVGTPVTITGTNFGSTGTVTFGGTIATTTSWSATSIATSVPTGVSAGNVNVVVTVNGVASNGVNFTVTSSGGAPITLVQHNSRDAGTTTSSTLAFNANNTTGNWIGVCIRAGQPGEVFTVADSRGNAYRKAIQFNETVDGTTLGVFYAENIFGGPNTITVSDTISGTLRFAILEYSGVAIANSLDGAAIAAQGTSASPNSGNLTTTANGDLLLGEIWTANPANFTAGSGYLIEERVPTEPNTKLIVEDQVQTLAGSTSASASLGVSDNWGAALAAFRP